MENTEQNSVSKDDKTIAMLIHFAGIISIIGPLVVWIIKKDQSDYVDKNGRISLNYQIPIFIISVIIVSIVKVFGVGGFILTFIGLINVILCLLNGYKANIGKYPNYPISIKIL